MQDARPQLRVLVIQDKLDGVEPLGDAASYRDGLPDGRRLDGILKGYERQVRGRALHGRSNPPVGQSIPGVHRRKP